MEIQILSQKQNPMLKRTEVTFQTEHGQNASTPSRPEMRKAIAATLKVDEGKVFVRKFETKTGTHTVVGVANVYESPEQAKLTEPRYVFERNVPLEKPKEEAKG